MHAIELNSNGVEWTGTFAVIVNALANDLLSDGEPVSDVVLIHQADENFGILIGSLTAVEDGVLTMEASTLRDGPVSTHKVPVTEVIKITVD